MNVTKRSPPSRSVVKRERPSIHKLLRSLSARQMEGHPSESPLQVVVLDLAVHRGIPLVLEELVDGLLDLRAKHPLGVLSLVIIRLTVVVHFSHYNVRANEMAALVTRVHESEITVIIQGEIVHDSRALVGELQNLRASLARTMDAPPFVKTTKCSKGTSTILFFFF